MVMLSLMCKMNVMCFVLALWSVVWCNSDLKWCRQWLYPGTVFLLPC